MENHCVPRRVVRQTYVCIVLNENFKVCRDATVVEMRQRHDAILRATCVYKARDIKAPAVSTRGVVKALDYLTASNRVGFGDAVPQFEDGSLNAKDKNVVVIGGGEDRKSTRLNSSH